MNAFSVGPELLFPWVGECDSLPYSQKSNNNFENGVCSSNELKWRDVNILLFIVHFNS